MNTRDDIQHEQRLNITVLVTDIDEWTHDKIAYTVHLKDRKNNSLELTVFHNNDIATHEWETGRWYRLKNAMGNVFRGTKQLNPSYDLSVTLLDEPPQPENDGESANTNIDTHAKATDDTESDAKPAGTERLDDCNELTSASERDTRPQTTADGGGQLREQQPFSPGDYLLHFELGELSELPVHEYELKTNNDDGIDPEDFTNGIKGFTAKAANHFRYQIHAPVTIADASRRRIYATEKLHEAISFHGYTITPVHQGTTTLEARSYTDDGPLHALVKQDVKHTLNRQFEVAGIDEIIEPMPHRTANSGLFEAYRKYKCRIRVDADGTVICGVNVAYHLESTFSATEWVKRGFDIEGVSVEHDTERYDSPRTATVVELIDMNYEDILEGPGTSMKKYHERYVEQDVIDAVAAGDPLIADLQYGSDNESIFPQVLEYCKVIPTFDQLSDVDPAFFKTVHAESRMKPDERFNTAASFIDLLGPTPFFGFDPQPQVTNTGYREYTVSNRPNLRFGNGQTAFYGGQGLERNSYDIYRAPGSFDVIALYPADEESNVRSYILALLNKLDEYNANPSDFEMDTYELGSEFHYSQPAQKAHPYDAALVVVPDKEAAAAADYDDPYPEFKRRLGQAGVPSQMITLDNVGTNSYRGNICSSLIGKAGGVPWRIDDIPGNVDAFVGLDVTYDNATGQHLGAAANVVMTDGTILASEAISKQAGETFDEDNVADVIKHVLSIFHEEEGHPPRHVTIHRDGKFYLNVEQLIERLEKARDLIQHFDLIELRKSGNPRIAAYNGSQFTDTDKGTAFQVHNGEHAYLTTTGGKESVPGTPRPLQLVKRYGSTDMETLIEQVYWLSEAHVGSLSRSTRLPITTYYADRCADYAMKGYLIKDRVIRGVPYI